MPPSLARRRLPALLAQLRASGVTSYEELPGGLLKLTLALRPAGATEDLSDTRPVSKRDEAPRRAPKRDAVALAIGGIEYDPEADEPAEAKA